jgi:hypothetical protein
MNLSLMARSVHLISSGTKNKNNSYRNKNNTLNYGPGWGRNLPLNFLVSK